MKQLLVAIVLAFSVILTGCGKVVEVPPASVAKIQTKDGYREGVIPTSRFRLPYCVWYCDNLVTLSVNDFAVTEEMKLFMPEDRLNLDFAVRLTLSVNPEQYELLFNRITPSPTGDGRLYRVDLNRAYTVYAQPQILAEVREFMSEYSISQIASSREAIGGLLAERLTRVIGERTPFVVRYAGLADVDYPPIIVQAQERAAERREEIQQEEAQLEIARVALNRKLEEQQLQRRIDVEKAEAEAQVNRILASTMTPAYEMYRQLQIMERMAQSDNKVFVPVGMLDSVASQVQLGRQ